MARIQKARTRSSDRRRSNAAADETKNEESKQGAERERESSEAPEEVLTVPQLAWRNETLEARTHSMSPRRTHSKRKTLFGTLDEPFDETENRAATMEFDKDYLKAKGLESVKAARSRRVRGLFSS